MTSSRKLGIFAIIGPGLLVAATGVGAGDLATGAIVGQKLGVAVLWAVLVGAALKFIVNEGLARWQLATGSTFLEGATSRLGKIVLWIFLPYLLIWSVYVGAALISASGAAMHALVPGAFEDAETGKTVFGIIQSLVGVGLVLVGGYKLFEKIMGVAIVVMFITVLVTAFRLDPEIVEVLRGLFVPAKETITGDGLASAIALLGGVGGTVTVLCYGYWIREEERHGSGDLKTCRLDLAVGYSVTAIFGLAMVIIGSRVEASGKGATLLADLGRALGAELGTTMKWMFLIGAWGAIFSSLLGVWQAVPYLFADVCDLIRRPRVRGEEPHASRTIDTRGLPYRAYLVGIAIVPMLGLVVDFRKVQTAYAIFGACFVPLAAIGLLLLNGRADWIGARYRNRPLTVVLLALSVLLFGWFFWPRVEKAL